jgi:serine/threonine-protein kinase
MAADPQIDRDAKFIETCVELKLLKETDAQLLQRSVDLPGYAAQEAVKLGLLTAADVDIVHSLQYPTETVPGYEIQSVIGRGGMGVVYRARQSDLDRIVALKTILINNVSNPTVAARFEREAKALARLQHPNIVQALNFGKHQGRYFFAMEFVPGRTCEQAIRDDGIMPAQNVWFLVREVASGLLHALNQNLIHRDIKPANLILVPPPEGSRWAKSVESIKIADFGLAMFADVSDDKLKLTTGDKIMGSPAYMSPEQFGLGDVDFRTDMYALGATAWHLLFGSPPFVGSSVAQLYQQKLQPLEVDPAALPTTIPESHWRLLMGLLDPDPNRRPPSYEVLIEAIDQLELSEPMARPATGLQASTIAPSADDQLTLDAVELAVTEDSGSPKPAAEPGQPTVAPTIELASPPSNIWRRLIIGVAILGVCGIIFALWPPGLPSRGPRTYTRVVSSTPLFDGFTLKGWDVGGTMVGAWNPMEAPDASTAIACTGGRGALTRQLPNLQHPRIILFAWLAAKDAIIDIDFGFDALVPGDDRGCLRLAGSGLQLGIKDSDFGDLDVVDQAQPPAKLHDRFHVIHVERQRDDWFVFVEEQLIGTLPIASVGNGDALRLVVHESNPDGGDEETPAYFADLQISELRSKQPIE